jgi:GNAT superfamily N-acetyltransferase
MQISIIEANSEDAAEILALQKVAYQTEAELYEDWTIPPLTQTLSQIEAEFATKIFLKAVLADRIVGSVRASFDRGTCFIGRLIVNPDYQGKGIGTQRMQKVETFFHMQHGSKYIRAVKAAITSVSIKSLGIKYPGRKIYQKMFVSCLWKKGNQRCRQRVSQAR